MSSIRPIQSDRNPFLTTEGLTVSTAGGLVLAGPIDLSLEKGEIFGLVGESGSGKSVSAMALMRLAGRSLTIGGEARIGDVPIPLDDEKAMRRLRGSSMAMIFQEPLSSLNPLFSVGEQILSVILAHTEMSKSEARKRALAAMRDVGIPNPEARFDSYPHQFSGGMCQRIAIAMALSSGARFLIADEPTTALDATIQNEIVLLIERLVEERGLSVLFISHDLGLVARIAGRVAVMYGGEIVETGPTADILSDPKHPYTQGLVRCIADLSTFGKPQPGLPGQPAGPGRWPTGCRFRDRCDRATTDCERVQALTPLAQREVRCWQATDKAAEAAQ